jgi:hypothetical protein
VLTEWSGTPGATLMFDRDVASWLFSACAHKAIERLVTQIEETIHDLIIRARVIPRDSAVTDLAPFSQYPSLTPTATPQPAQPRCRSRRSPPRNAPRCSTLLSPRRSAFRLRAPEEDLDALAHGALGTHAHVGVARPVAANAIAEHPITSNRTHVSDLPLPRYIEHREPKSVSP